MNLRASSVCALLAIALGVTACSDVLGYDKFQFGAGDRTSAAAPAGSDPIGSPTEGDGGSASPRTLGAPPQGGGPTPQPSDGGAPPADSGASIPAPITSDGGYTGLPPSDPLGHSAADVCAQWSAGHVVTDGQPWTAGASECDPGTLTQAGVNDTLARLAMFRWMVGLAAVGERVMDRSEYMACGAVASWNPPGGSFSPHSPPPTAKCYSDPGAAGAGSANIGWGGRVPADAIDQFVEDNGNETTFGHRRWIFNPPLGAVGIGFYAGGGPYGSAQCLGVFDFSGTGPSPTWIAFPPPGFFPIDIANWSWTFHHQAGVATSLTVVRASDNATLPMTTFPLNQGYGNYGVAAFRPQGWALAAGETYHVTVDGITGGPIAYDLKPIACQ